MTKPQSSTVIENPAPTLTPPDQRTPPQQPPHQPKRRGWLGILVVLLVAAGGYYYWTKRNPSQAGGAAPEPGATGKKGRGGGTIPVVAVKAQRGSMSVYVTGLGAVAPIYTVTVKSRVDGQLM